MKFYRLGPKFYAVDDDASIVYEVEFTPTQTSTAVYKGHEAVYYRNELSFNQKKEEITAEKFQEFFSAAVEAMHQTPWA